MHRGAALSVVWLFLAVVVWGQESRPPLISGTVTDPQSKPVAGVRVLLFGQRAGRIGYAVTDESGRFSFSVSHAGVYTIEVEAPGFQQVSEKVQVRDGTPTVADIHLGSLAEGQESITVTADVKDSSILFPDPAQRVYVRQEILDANPGRPGAPISIPGLPIETASGGIKAPQYFAPGVAGDHGEPIAEYLHVGSYLLSNNLSANAHGNGYADPNIMIPAVLEGVQTDGGAFNVREGNHSENVATIYEFRPRLESFLTVTGDYRDVDAAAGWSPKGPETDAWVAIEAAYGNGFLDRLEHRQQYKINGFRVWNPAHHQLTLLGIGYYGFSYIPGLVPLDTPDLHDTIDPRQKDQTHTGELALSDLWNLSPASELQVSGMFRTYNLSLLSNFGDSLIRQSEFRTVSGGNGTYINNLAKSLSLMAGVDYQRDAPRRLDLDRYDSPDPSSYGQFSGQLSVQAGVPHCAISCAGWRAERSPSCGDR